MVTPSCIWLGTTHPCNPPQYGLWVNLHFFMICMYKHCFLPMLLVFVMKYCIKMPCSPPLNSLPIACPPWHHLYFCVMLMPSPTACPPCDLHVCYVDVYCFFYFLSVLKFHLFVLFFYFVVFMRLWLFKKLKSKNFQKFIYYSIIELELPNYFQKLSFNQQTAASQKVLPWARSLHGPFLATPLVLHLVHQLPLWQFVISWITCGLITEAKCENPYHQ